MQMEMQMRSGDTLSINTGLPEVPSFPVVPDANVSVNLPPTLQRHQRLRHCLPLPYLHFLIQQLPLHL
jgi:hypothetical protein